MTGNKPKLGSVKRRLRGRAGAAWLAAAFALTAALETLAADSGTYVGLNVPVMFVDDTVSATSGTMMTQGTVPYTAKAETTHETGFKLAGVAGYEFGSGLRIEGELFFARAGIDRLNYTGTTAGGNPVSAGRLDVPISGTADQLGVLANVWYDIDTGSQWIPFAGGGIGFMRVDQGDVKYDRNALAQSISDLQARAAGQPSRPLPSGFVPKLSTTDTAFVWHVGAGTSYRLSESVTLQAGYRLQANGDLEFKGSNRYGTVRSETSMRIHFFEIGVRYRF